jgi:peptidyl-prolyl cis-trans isomerase C
MMGVVQCCLTEFGARVSVPRTLGQRRNYITHKELMKTRVVLVTFAVAVMLVCRTFAADKPKAGAATNAPVVATAAKPDEVVARVNGVEIKRKELDAAVQAFTFQMSRRGRPLPPGQSAEVERDILDELIGRELLRQEGSKHIPADIDKKVQEQIDQVTTQVGGEEQLKKTLAETGITSDEYAKRVRDNVIIRGAIDSAVDKEVKITPEEVRAFYDKNPDQFKQPEMVRASHILIRCAPDATDEVKKEKRTQIDSVRALVKGGEKFADVAKKFSEDPGTAPNGGDLGFFGRGQMVPEFDAAAFSLKTNEVSDVITTQFGYHVLMVTGHKPAQTIPFDQVKDDLAKFLKQRKGNDITRDQVASLRKAAKVEILVPEPPPAPVVETPPMQAPAK